MVIGNGNHAAGRFINKEVKAKLWGQAAVSVPGAVVESPASRQARLLIPVDTNKPSAGRAAQHRIPACRHPASSGLLAGLFSSASRTRSEAFAPRLHHF